MKRNFDEKKLHEYLKSGEAADVFLLYGEEKYLVRKYTQAVTDGAKADEVLRYNRESFDLDELTDAVTMVPFGGGMRCIVITDVDVDGMQRGEFDKLCDILSQPMTLCRVVLSFPTMEFGGKPSQNLKKLIQLVSEQGVAAELKKRSEQDTISFLESRIKDRGCTAKRTVCAYLLSRCGYDMNLLSTEADKLCAYRRGKEIAQEHVDAVCTELLSASAFDISKKLLSGDLGGALAKLSNLYELREEPVAVLAALSTAFVDIYRAKVMTDAGADTKLLSGSYSYAGREFRISNALRDGKKYPAEAIGGIIDVLIDTDKALKSSRVDKQILLDSCVAKIYVLLHGRRAAS